MHRLQQVVAGRCQKSTFRLVGFVGLFQCQFLFGQGIGKLLGTVIDPFFQHRLIFTERGNIGKGSDKAAALNRGAAHLDHQTILANPFKFMRTADFHPVNPFIYMLLNRTWSTFTLFRVITD